MKIYRLEGAGVGKGPFTCSISYPSKWVDTHFAPHDERNISHHAYEKWLETYFPTSSGLPEEFHFGFLTLNHLNTAFQGWQDIEDFVLLECEINITNNEDFLILSDGQVMYRKLISKTDITDQFRTKESKVKEEVSPEFTSKLVSPVQVREDIKKEVQRHLDGFTQYLQHQVNKGFRDAVHRNNLGFTINLNCTLMSHKYRFDEIMEAFRREMSIKGWAVEVIMDDHKYTLNVSEDLPF